MEHLPETVPMSRRIILYLSFGAFIRDAGQYVIWVIMSVYLSEVWHVPYVSIGFVFLTAGLLSIPLTTLGGNLIDRIGRRKPAVFLPWILCILSLSLFYLVYYHTSLLLILVLFVAAGPLMSFQYVVMSTIVSDITSESERISGFSALRIASNVGIGIGLVLGGLLAQFNYSYVFILSFVGYLVEGVLYYLRVPETVPESVSMHNDSTGTKKSVVAPYRDTFFLMISVINALAWFFTGMFESAITPLYMSNVNHFSSLSITVLFAINSTIVVVLQTPLNRVLRNMRDSLRIVLGLIVYAIAYLMLASTSVYLIVAFTIAVLTMGENLVAPASSSLITKIAPEENRGAYLGFNGSINSMIDPFRTLVGTALLAAFFFSPELSWLTISFISMALAMIFLMIFKSITRRRLQMGHGHI